MKFRDKSPAAKAICEPRWEGWTDKSRHDPCGGCPLYVPCIKKSPGPGREAFNRWIEGINEAAERAREFEGMTGAGYRYMAANVRSVMQEPKS